MTASIPDENRPVNRVKVVCFLTFNPVAEDGAAHRGCLAGEKERFQAFAMPSPTLRTVPCLPVFCEEQRLPQAAEPFRPSPSWQG